MDANPEEWVNERTVELVVTSFVTHPDVRDAIFHTPYNPRIPHGKQRWNKMIDKQISKVLQENPEIPRCADTIPRYQSLTKAIGFRALCWARFHEENFELIPEYTKDFLNASHFTENGTIDREQAARNIVTDETQSVIQRYRMACFYCLSDHTDRLWEQISTNGVDRNRFITNVLGDDTEHSLIVIWCVNEWLWEYAILGQLISQEAFSFRLAARAGNDVAVKYYWNKMNESEKWYNACSIAHVLVNDITERGRDDWGIFSKFYTETEWIPNDYLCDVLFILFNQMDEMDEMDFFLAEIGRDRYSKVLNMCLEWPYQCHYIDRVYRLFRCVEITKPEYDFGVQMTFLADKICHSDVENIKQGEEHTYNYKNLFTTVWKKSTRKFKVMMLQGGGRGTDFVAKLVKFGKNIEQIIWFVGIVFKIASHIRKTRIRECWDMKMIGLNAIDKRGKDFTDRLLAVMLPYDDIEIFKKSVFKHCSDDLILDRKYDRFDQLMEWTLGSTEEEIFEYKKKYIEKDDYEFLKHAFSVMGKQGLDFLFGWCYPPPEILAAKHAICRHNVVRGFIYHLYSIDENAKLKMVFSWLGIKRDDIRQCKVKALFMGARGGGKTLLQLKTCDISEEVLELYDFDRKKVVENFFANYIIDVKMFKVCRRLLGKKFGGSRQDDYLFYISAIDGIEDIIKIKDRLRRERNHPETTRRNMERTSGRQWGNIFGRRN